MLLSTVIQISSITMLLCNLIAAESQIQNSNPQLKELACILFGGEFCTNHTITTRQVYYYPTRPTSYESNGYYGSTGNVVHVEIYMEAQCGDSTRFVRRQLGPVWEKFKNTGRLDIKAIVFGKASCHPEAGDYSCRCQHGQRECDLNQLMNCVQDFFFNDAKRYIPVFTCIQGKTDLDYAKDYCIANNPDLPLETIMKCATGRRGRILMAAAGQKTAALDPPLSNVPLIRVDGEKSIDAFYEFQETICAKMKPQPAECSK